jgi:general secretion pathway protein F
MEPLYRYKARARDGSLQAGQMRSASEVNVARELASRGLTPVEIASPERLSVTRAEVSGTSALQRRRRVNARDLQGMLQELATLLGAGISLADALPTLVSSYVGRPLGRVLATASQRVRQGSALSAALDQPGVTWPPYVMALLRAGEASGEMAQALHDASRQMEIELSVSQELRSALIYPAVLVAAGTSAVLFIFMAVVPRFAGMLKSSRAQIPEFSRWVIESGLYLQQHVLMVGLVAAALALVCSAAFGQPAVRDSLLQGLARLPVLGPWLHSIDLGRWASVLGSLLGNRVPFIEAIRLSAGTMRISSLREGLYKGAAQLQQGRALSDVLEDQTWFPATRLSLVRVGERAGELPRMLRSLGELETQAARLLQRRVLALIEPAAIVIIGAAIGVIMVAVILAVTGLNTSVA